MAKQESLLPGPAKEPAKAKARRKKTTPELQKFIQANGPVTSFTDVLKAAEPRPPETADQNAKKLYATRLSNAMAVLVASKLAPYFEGVLPNPDGTGGESRARTGKGVKKLDVNYSTPELGLGLGVSIKSANYRDHDTARYTKNYTARDAELRAEAMDYHIRQPFAVLVAIVLVPVDACDDGDPKFPKRSWSSFAQAVDVYRHRIGHDSHEDDPQLFERGFIGLYEYAGPRRGEVRYFDIAHSPPQFGRPNKDTYDLDGVIQHTVRTYDSRNHVKKAWHKGEPEAPVPFAEYQEIYADETQSDSDEQDEG